MAQGAGAKLFEYIQRERQDLTVLAFVDTYKKVGSIVQKKSSMWIRLINIIMESIS